MTDLFGSREFRMAVVCCRWPRSDADDAAIRAAAADAFDWDRLLALIGRHRINGLVHHALLHAGVAPPENVAKKLATRARNLARRNLVLVHETARLQDLFDAAGIPSTSIKGVALSQLAYGSLSLKQTRDVDILISRDRVLSALRLLEDDGYQLPKDLNVAQRRAVVRFGKELELVHSERKLRVDLHWQLARNPTFIGAVDAASPTQNVIFPDGSAVRTLRDDDLFVFLCVHGAGHHWSRLKWLADLHAFIARTGYDVGLITRYYRYAQQNGAGLCAGQALLLCHNLLGLHLPTELATALNGDKRMARLVSVANRAIADPVPDSEPGRGDSDTLRGMMVQYLYGRGWRFFLAQFKADLVSIGDIERLPLPVALHFLYLFMRVPLWLRRRAGRGRAAHAPPRPNNVFLADGG